MLRLRAYFNLNREFRCLSCIKDCKADPMAGKIVYCPDYDSGTLLRTSKALKAIVLMLIEPFMKIFKDSDTKEWICPRCGYHNSNSNTKCMGHGMSEYCGYPKIEK